VTVLLRPDARDRRIVGGYIGHVLVGMGLLHLPAILTALALGEINDAAGMTIGALLSVVLGGSAHRRWSTAGVTLDWAHGLVTVAMAWLVAPLPVGVSLLLSGHFNSFLDAYFEAMSGLTTSGMSMLLDLDHLGTGVQLLRHLTHFAGGQGIILVVLTVLASGQSQIGSLFVGEGRDERIVPSVIRTARLIYVIFAAWFIAGTAFLWTALIASGVGPGAAVMHAVSLFLAAFDTGGFSIHSQSVGYYHSALLELTLIPIMLAGAVSFPMHYDLWQRRVRPVTRHLDIRMLATTTTALTFLILLGLAIRGTYPDAISLTRKGVFTALSAATNTGFSVLPGRAYSQWGQLAPSALVAMMLIGSMAGSTAGGIKTIRVALIAKSVLRDIRKALSPPSSVVTASFHGRRRRMIITDQMVRAAVVMTVLYLATAIGGAMVHVFYGATIEQGLFESVSATANVGLSVGFIGPTNPPLLKVVTMLQMWAGRLEFLAAISLVGYAIAMVRGRR
jgi:trk system potassium uptake protein TrkH